MQVRNLIERSSQKTDNKAVFKLPLVRIKVIHFLGFNLVIFSHLISPNNIRESCHLTGRLFWFYDYKSSKIWTEICWKGLFLLQIDFRMSPFLLHWLSYADDPYNPRLLTPRIFLYSLKLQIRVARKVFLCSPFLLNEKLILHGLYLWNYILISFVMHNCP